MHDDMPLNGRLTCSELTCYSEHLESRFEANYAVFNHKRALKPKPTHSLLMSMPTNTNETIQLYAKVPSELGNNARSGCSTMFPEHYAHV